MLPTQEKKLILPFIMLSVLILLWGFNWPILKMALQDTPPIWMGSIRLLMGSTCVFIFLVISKKFAFPTRKDLPILFSVGFLQMFLYMMFTNLGLHHHVAASRSSILAYITPLWVTPLAFFWLKEKVSGLKLMGFLFSLLGVVILFNPWAFNWQDQTAIVGNALLLLASLVWAICILHARFNKWHLSPLQLLPWQMLLASFLTFLIAVNVEPFNQIHWSKHFIALLFYIGPLGTAVGYWLAIDLSRQLPSTTTSLFMLGVPALGIISSHIILAEPIYKSMIIAMICIVTGLFCAAKDNQQQEKLRQEKLSNTDLDFEKSQDGVDAA